MTFFSFFPDVTTNRGKTWIARIRRDSGINFVANKNTKVCSLHFTAEDYINGNALYSARRVLKPTAVPSVFPWTKDQYHRTTAVSQLATSPYQRFDRFDDKVEQHSDKHKPADDTSDAQFMEVDSEYDDVTKFQTEVEDLRAQLTIAEATLGNPYFVWKTFVTIMTFYQVLNRIF